MRARNRAKSMRKGADASQVVGDGERRTGSNETYPGAGPGGYCVCTNCGIQMEHQRGTPCFYMNCPKCGASMQRM
jgi:hypothetical protein